MPFREPVAALIWCKGRRYLTHGGLSLRKYGFVRGGPAGIKAADRGLVQARLSEDFPVVLGEQGGRASDAGRGAIEAPRPCGRRIGADDWVQHGLIDAALVDVRVGQNLPVG